MRFIQYYDMANWEGITACCVAAYSARKNGRLKDCTYTFYYPDYKTLRNNKLVASVFDEIAPIPEPVNSVIDNLPDWNKDIRIHVRSLCCWRKFLCWLFTPGDVIFTDYDVVCYGRIDETIPPDGYYISGRRVPLGDEKGKVLNHGMLAKNKAFDATDMREIMLETLFNKKAWKISHANWEWHDEASSWWLFNKRGFDGYYELDRRFNMFAHEHIWTKKSIENNDVRLLHYIGGRKPWKKCPKTYRHLIERWKSLKEEMMNSVLQ